MLFARQNIPEDVVEFLTERGKAVRAFDEFGLLALSEIDSRFENVLSAFPRQNIDGTLSATLARHGLSGVRIATHDRAMHVGYYFDEGRSTGDVSKLVQEGEQAGAVEEALREGTTSFVLVNFSAPDVAARRGDIAGATAAIEATDAAIGTIATATEAAGGALFVVGTHGAAEMMLDGDGKPRGTHTTNPTPLLYANVRDARSSLATGGRLEDVAPTILDVLGLDKPEGMTGRTLRCAR